MPSYTFAGLPAGRTATIYRQGRGASGAAVTSGTVAGDGTLTLTLDDLGTYRAEVAGGGGGASYAELVDDSTTQQADIVSASATSDASALTTGTLAEARLPASVPLSPDIDSIVKLTQAAYDALATKDARTLYLISG